MTSLSGFEYYHASLDKHGIQQQLKEHNIPIKILFKKYLSVIRPYLNPRVTSHPASNINHHPTLRPVNSTNTQIRSGLPALIPPHHKKLFSKIQEINHKNEMKIATLQFSPKLGDTAGNIKRADELLKNGGRSTTLGKANRIEELKPDILVLSEMALTGYNFPNLEAVKPYLEEAGMGPCGIWAKETAKKFGCKVCVGYPEVERSGEGGGKEMYYNSLLVVDEKGEILANYRKTFLYYTDETWAAEGDAGRGFRHISFPRQGQQQQQEVATSFGICMDINPYRFEAPWTAWEFANRILDTRSQLVLLSMAWLTHSDREELQALHTKPELGTFNYWVQRLMPLFRRHMEHSSGLGGEDEGEKRMIVVFANRVGEEEGHGEDKEPVRYAGTSAVLGFSQRAGSGSGAGSEDRDGIDVKILCWDIMGATEEGVCFANTGEDPEMVFSLAKDNP